MADRVLPLRHVRSFLCGRIPGRYVDIRRWLDPVRPSICAIPLTRARADIGDYKDPWDIATAAYDDEFLAMLKQEFEFDSLEPKRTQSIRYIGRQYILGRRLEDDQEFYKRSQAEYRNLLKETDHFLELLKKSYNNHYFYNIATEMLTLARGMNLPEPQSDFPDLTEHQRDVESHYRELVRLTELLKIAADHGMKFAKREVRPGPKMNFGLELLVRKAADFWIGELKRKFTVDYHQGSGLTPAFEFVRALVKPLDDVPDDRIITAMRGEITERRKMGISN